ncbi:MAG: TM2 domain-containing protein [Eubacteriaceae bacterium]|nr:TM2 domain-containing protein [Eubacteriaceae bacterium]
MSQFQYQPDQEKSVKYCPSCGQASNVEDVFCSSCGTRMDEVENIEASDPSFFEDQPTSSANEDFNHYDNTYRSSGAFENSSYNTNEWITYTKAQKNKWVSLLLCIFTIFGHKIYEGKWGKAVLYLFTGGLFGVGWLIDIIKLASGPEYYDVD